MTEIETNTRTKPTKIVHYLWSAEWVVCFYNQRGTAEQWIKEGKNAMKWTWVSCQTFLNNAVRLQLHALAYNLGNFVRTLALPKEVMHWSLTTLKKKRVNLARRSCATVCISLSRLRRSLSRDLYSPRSSASLAGCGQRRYRHDGAPSSSIQVAPQDKCALPRAQHVLRVK